MLVCTGGAWLHWLWLIRNIFGWLYLGLWRSLMVSKMPLNATNTSLSPKSLKQLIFFFFFTPWTAKLRFRFPLAFVISLFSPPYNDPQLKCHLAYLVFSDTCWSSQPSWVSHSHIQLHAGEMVTRAELNTWLAWLRPWWWKQCRGGCSIQCAD